MLSFKEGGDRKIEQGWRYSRKDDKGQRGRKEGRSFKLRATSLWGKVADGEEKKEKDEMSFLTLIRCLYNKKSLSRASR